MAVYVCGRCQFTFERVGEVTACEDCGNGNVRLADESEIAEFLKNKGALGKERGKADG